MSLCLFSILEIWENQTFPRDGDHGTTDHCKDPIVSLSFFLFPHLFFPLTQERLPVVTWEEGQKSSLSSRSKIDDQNDVITAPVYIQPQGSSASPYRVRVEYPYTWFVLADALKYLSYRQYSARTFRAFSIFYFFLSLALGLGKGSSAPCLPRPWFVETTVLSKGTTYLMCASSSITRQ